MYLVTGQCLPSILNAINDYRETIRQLLLHSETAESILYFTNVISNGLMSVTISGYDKWKQKIKRELDLYKLKQTKQ